MPGLIDHTRISRMPTSKARTWVTTGSETDVRLLLKTWDSVFRFRLEEIPENNEIYWDLNNVLLLQQHGRDSVRISGSALFRSTIAGSLSSTMG